MALYGARRALLTPPRTLLGRRQQGFAADFANDSVLIRDLTTPANNFKGTVQQAIDAGILSFTRATTATRFDASGLLETVASGAWRRQYDPVSLAPLGYLAELSVTQYALWNRDFTNAAWTKSNMTAAKTATGIDGVANSASTLTATAANATALQTLVSGSSSRVSAMYVKRRTGSGVINITHDNGTTWTPVTVTSVWTRVSNPTTTASNPTFGVRIVTSGDSIDVDYFHHQLARLSNPIATTSSYGTKNADNMTVSLSKIPFSTSEGSILFRGYDPGSIGIAVYGIAIDDGTTNNEIAVRSTGTPVRSRRVRAGAALVATFSEAGAVAQDNLNKDAFTWKANDFHGASELGEFTPVTTGAVPTGLTTLRIGTDSSGAAAWHRVVRSIVVLPEAISQAECDLAVRAA